MQAKISRRNLAKAAIAGTGISLIPSHVLGRMGAIPPSDKANLAFIGIGNYGSRALKELNSQNIAAVCDVDWRPEIKGGAGQVIVDYPKAKRFDDWRVMLAEMDKSIDAVVISSTDHTHAVAAITAMKMRKSVFCEKPLAHSIDEVRAMMAAQRKYKVATQTGFQGHASEDLRNIVEWVQNGALGTVKEVHAFQSPAPQLTRYYPEGPYEELQHVRDQFPVPPEVKWDLWLGPAPVRPFNPMYLPLRWRNWLDFGTGILGDHGPHFLDPVVWALNLGFPETIEAETDAAYDPGTNTQTFSRTSIVRYTFPAVGQRPAVPVTWHGIHTPAIPKGWPAEKPFPNGGGIIIGTQGTLVYGPIYTSKPGSPLPGQVTLLPAELDRDYKRPEKTLPRPTSHWLEWIGASKSGKQPSGDFEYGGLVTQIALLGNIAVRNKGQLLRFDPKTQKFTNSNAANAMFEQSYRSGWALPHI